MSINALFFLATVPTGQEPGPPAVCPTCAPPESDLLPMLVVAAVMFGAGWLIRALKARRARK